MLSLLIRIHEKVEEVDVDTVVGSEDGICDVVLVLFIWWVIYFDTSTYLIIVSRSTSLYSYIEGVYYGLAWHYIINYLDTDCINDRYRITYGVKLIYKL